jgi:hypothetical protein
MSGRRGSVFMIFSSVYVPSQFPMKRLRKA